MSNLTDLTLTGNNNVVPFRSAVDAVEMVRRTSDWIPDPGVELHGIIKGIRPRAGTYPGHQLLVGAPNGSITAIWLTQWMKAERQGYGAEVGDEIALIYLGQKTSAANRRYNAFELFVTKSPPPDGAA